MRKITEKMIIDLLSSRSYRPMDRRQLYHQFKARTAHERKMLRELLKSLEKRGRIIRVKGNNYAIPRELDLVTGRLQVNKAGFGFIIPADGKGDDVYIHRENMSTAMDGDLVVCRLLQEGYRRRKGPSRRGNIIRIIERANETVVGTINRTHRFYYIVPDNPRILSDIYVAQDDLGGAKEGDKVVGRITEWPSRHLNPEGKIVEVLGRAHLPSVGTEAVIRDHKLRRTFPKEALDEAGGISQEVSARDLEGREDLREILTFTVDPETARDFDDAVSLRQEGDKFILGVHIADVSHYVRPETALDREVYERGTSVYFPARVLPMLPESLSNGICSLKEGLDRLTQSAFLTFSSSGKRLGYSFKPSVIKSRRRFSYAEIRRILNDQSDLPRPDDASIVPTIMEMEKLAAALRRRRFERGAVDINLPESVIRFDEEGRIVAVETEEMDMSHIIIEEFMIAANEAVGDYFSKHRIPAVYRVHEDPDPRETEEFVKLARALGYEIERRPSKKELQEVLDRAGGRPESYVMHTAFVRSLKRAQYSPKNIGHYGLASRAYAYFTSPIRRYPDLNNHRSLLAAPSGGKYSPQIGMEEIARHSTETELEADAAEKDVILIRKLQFFKQHIEERIIEELDGLITGVMNFGFKVYINRYLLSGLVHASSLRGDFFRATKDGTSMIGRRTRKKYRIGDMVKVIPAKVDLVKREIDFGVVEEQPSKRK